MKNEVKVLAVDDGFEKIINLNDIRVYPETKCKLPRMASKCRLRNFYPPGFTNTWPQKSIDFFCDIVRDSHLNPFVVTNVQKVGDFYEVELYGNNEGFSITNVMVHMKFGVVNNFTNSSLDSEIKSDLMLTQIQQAQGYNRQNNFDWESYDDCEESLTQTIANVIEGGYTPKDAARLCKFTKVNGQKCFKGDRCTFEHTLPNPDGWTGDKQQVYTDTIGQIELPAVGDKLTVLVTFVKSVCKFYAQIKLSKAQKTALAASNIISSTSQFIKYMDNPENVKSLKKLKILPALGELVLAQSSVDNGWYRSRIITINSEEEIHVFFIDFGNLDIVKLENLRQIEIKHLGMPAQAIEFRIASCDPIDASDYHYNLEAAKHLSEKILDKIGFALVTKSTYPLEVEIFIDNINIADYLKMHKFAKERDLRYVPSNLNFAPE